MSRFSSLFKIQCTHSYFADGLCHALTLQPSEACAELLACYQLRFRPETGGGEVYYRPGVSPLAQFVESAPLVFWLLNSDPQLANYTEIATSGGSGLFYFDNLACPPFSSNLNGKGPLTTPQLPAMPSRFSLPVQPPLQAATLTLASQFGSNGTAPVWQQQSPDALLATLPMTFGQLPEGRYQLAANGDQLLDFWLGAAPANAWGMVAIYPGGPLQAGKVAAAARVIGQQGQITPKTYTLQLNARSLCWRYHLIGESGPSYQHYQLTATHKSGGGSPVGFGGAAGETINGLPSYRFVSQQPLALSERPGDIYSVQLQPGAGMPHAAELRLPYPRPGNISAVEQGVRYADVYVYL